ncbi:prepilin-type N-terminal cleavage/methylation domain-containing protein [Thiomicrospira sp. R3]|uniref:type II secretion system protein n=1 Tax=Thiomicrospira sp. R3 TaxID=3035472 RepID=UPI00259BEF27|nr:prepilin-type N-terminal cleavage/methylation domain-containing protein [Thiomicrospira sp. R3]WFE68954.1 prepilin-type N-terminal cleavage/methylation domain-containing protein [Thiomicrospira sp. R3]
MSITSHKNKKNGFTLVEVAIVIGIVGIIMMGLFAGMGAIRETVKFKQDQQKLQDIKQALISFASVNGHLPCPDTTGNGRENRELTIPVCTATTGNLPFIDLETHQQNAYGLPYTYVINQNANDASNALASSSSASYFISGSCLDTSTQNGTTAPCFKFDTPPMPGIPGAGNLRVQNDETGTRVFADHIPLVVISHGQNGCPGESIFEQHNCSPNGNSNVFYQAAQQRNSFDDVLIWLSAQEIKSATSIDRSTVRIPRRIVYNFAKMSSEEINEFLSREYVRYIDGRGGQNAWIPREKPGMTDEAGNPVDSLLSVQKPGEQILLVPIPADFKQYKISIKARLTQERHDSNQVWNEGGFAAFFDTYLEDNDITLRNNSRIQKGYVYQFDRGHTAEFSRQLIRPWNLLDINNYNNAEQAVDFYYPRYPAPADSDPKTQERIDYEIERTFVPDRFADPNWWVQVYQTDIIVTGSDTNRNANIRIVGWNDLDKDWTRLVAQFDYPKPRANSYLTETVTSKGVTIEHLIIGEKAQLYTGLRTWNHSPTEFHYLIIEEILE